jgi:hypothetical protein
MKKIFLTVLLGAAVAAPARSAEEAPKSAVSSLRMWFQHLKEGLSESAVSGHYQKANVTAVAAVRGAAQDSVEPEKPQWKGGKSKKAQQQKAERPGFVKAGELITEGKTQEGSAGLDAFEKAHPKSPLLKDVREARAKLKEMDAVPPDKP